MAAIDGGDVKVKITKAGKGKDKGAVRDEVWQRDSDLYGELKKQEQNVRSNATSLKTHPPPHASCLLLQRSTWVSIVFLAYGSLGVIYVSAMHGRIYFVPPEALRF